MSLTGEGGTTPEGTHAEAGWIMRIRVFFDDLKTPAMTAQDTKFAWGEVGIGSLDDTGRFDRFELRSVPAAR